MQLWIVWSYGIGEIIGGSQREDDIEKLEKRMDELGLKKRIMTSILIFVNMVTHAIQDLVLDLNVA